MRLRDRVSAFLGRASTEPIAFEPFSNLNFGIGIGTGVGQETLLRNNIGVPEFASRSIAARVSSLEPLVLTEVETVAGTTVNETLDDHPLKRLLDDPHPSFTISQLLRLTTQWIVTVGEAYWLKVGNGFGLPTELHPIPVGHCRPIVTRGVVEAYAVRDGQGRTETLAADKVCRFYFPDPENPWASEGYLEPAGITADSLKFSGQHLRRHYQKDATPKGVLETGENATQFNKTERDRFNEEWVNKHQSRSGLADGGPAVLPLGYKYIAQAMASGADVTPLLNFWQDQQLMGYGVPKSILGLVTSGDRSSAEVNQFVFDQHTVQPIANLIAQGITSQIAVDFDERIFVSWAPYISSDKDFELKQETADLLGFVRSVDQVREDRGLDQVPWGEQPVSTFGQQPYDPEGLNDDPPDTAGSLGDEDPDPEDEERTRAHRGDPFAPDVEWQRQVRREQRWIPLWLKSVRSIFREQQISVQNRLRNLRARQEFDPAQLFIPEEWARLFEVRVEPIRQNEFTTILRETLVGLNQIDEFAFTPLMSDTIREQGAQLVANTGRTTQKRLALELAQGVDEGESIDELARRVDSVFRTRIRQDSRTIARTETLKAGQSAQLAGFDTSGVVERKQWNTNRDEAVRDTHVFADGQIVPLTGSFDLFGEHAEAPGVGVNGAALSAGNAINCRCFVTPVLEA